MALVLAGGVAVACGGSVTTGGVGGTGGQGATGGHAGYPGTGGVGGYAGYPGTGGVGGYGGSNCASDHSSCVLPPPPSSKPPNTSGTKTVIAISKLFLGETNQQGQPDPTAWKSIGYNLDGLVSKPSDTNHCMPVVGANPQDVKTDGNGGIDNSYGENLLPLITSLSPDPSATTNQSIASGALTDLFRLDNLTLAPDQNGVSGALYGGANKGSPALFNGTDVWPVTYESVTNGNINAPRVTFPKSYVVNNVWVSGTKASIVLPLGLLGGDVQTRITRAIVSMQLKGVGTNAIAVHGTIAGIINTEAFIAQLKKVAGSFDSSLCSGATFDSIAQQIRAASDIMSDGSNGDPSKTCDAISVGIGFDGSGVSLGKVAAPATPLPDPCAP
jgi:hypothetical protein